VCVCARLYVCGVRVVCAYMRVWCVRACAYVYVCMCARFCVRACGVRLCVCVCTICLMLFEEVIAFSLIVPYPCNI